MADRDEVDIRIDGAPRKLRADFKHACEMEDEDYAGLLRKLLEFRKKHRAKWDSTDLTPGRRR